MKSKETQCRRDSIVKGSSMRPGTFSLASIARVCIMDEAKSRTKAEFLREQERIANNLAPAHKVSNFVSENKKKKEKEKKEKGKKRACAPCSTVFLFRPVFSSRGTRDRPSEVDAPTTASSWPFKPYFGVQYMSSMSTTLSIFTPRCGIPFMPIPSTPTWMKGRRDQQNESLHFSPSITLQRLYFLFLSLTSKPLHKAWIKCWNSGSALSSCGITSASP